MGNDLDAILKGAASGIRDPSLSTIAIIEANKKFGIGAILDWMESNYDGSTEHQMLWRVLYDFTKGHAHQEYKARMMAILKKSTK